MLKKFREILGDNIPIFLIFFIAYLGLGIYLVLVKEFQPGDAMARLVKAYLVYFGNEPKLSTIGFIWPPIPTLLLLTVSWVPYLVFSTLGIIIISAIFMTLACVIVNNIAKMCEAPRFWRYILVFLFGTNPMIVLYAINGYSEAIAIMVTLYAVQTLIRFWREDRNHQLIFSAALFGILPLIRYELATLTVAAGGMILLISIAKRYKATDDTFRDFIEGRVLAYSAMAIYPIFLWGFANWLIMDNPIFFLTDFRTAPSLSVSETSVQIYRSLPRSFGYIFFQWFSYFPGGLLTTLVGCIIGYKKRNYSLIGFSLFPLVVPFSQSILYNNGAFSANPRYFITVIPFTFILGLLIYYELLKDSENNLNKKTQYQKLYMYMLPLAFLLSSITTGWLIENRKTDEGTIYKTWTTLTSDQNGKKQVISEAIDIGKIIPNIVPSGSKILFDDFGSGFAVHLGAKNPKLFLDHTHPDYREALKNPYQYADYILIPRPDDVGRFNEIKMFNPDFYESEISWLTMVEGLPETLDGWVLLKVLKNNK